MSDHEPLSGYNIPDHQQETPLSHCHNCGGELYRGDLAYQVAGGLYCSACVSGVIVGEYADE